MRKDRWQQSSCKSNDKKFLDDCSPCSEDELIEAFCSAPLIFRGRLLKSTSSFLQQQDKRLAFVIDKLFRKPFDYDGIITKVRYAKEPKMQGTTLWLVNCCYNFTTAELEFSNGSYIALSRI